MQDFSVASAAQTARSKPGAGGPRDAPAADRRHVARRCQRGNGGNISRSSDRSSRASRWFAPTGRGRGRDTSRDRLPLRRHGAPRVLRAIVDRRVRTSCRSPDFHSGDGAAPPTRLADDAHLRRRFANALARRLGAPSHSSTCCPSAVSTAEEPSRWVTCTDTAAVQRIAVSLGRAGDKPTIALNCPVARGVLVRAGPRDCDPVTSQPPFLTFV